MPSRTANLIAFLTIATLLISSHVFVFRQLRSLLIKDFPAKAARLITIAKCVFIYFDLPFLYLFFLKHLTADMSAVTTFLIYPFAVWQFLMIVWTLILIPARLVRSRAAKAVLRRTVEPALKPIVSGLRSRLHARDTVYPSLDVSRSD